MTSELGPREAAARLGATTRSVQRWIASGRLPARRVGGRWRVAIGALDAFVGARAEPKVAAGPGWSAWTIGSVFVANRGEIARRIARTCDRLGVRVVLPDTDGPGALDLLDRAAVIRAARDAGADAIHPGFGFLAEDADFAQSVIDAGLVWIGPPPAAIRAAGDKAGCRRLAVSLGIPVAPGYDGPGQSNAVLARAAARIGYPVLVKPAAGGGGKGMRIVHEPARLRDALAAARREAAAAFGDSRLILERFVEDARHVEIQVLFDRHLNGVHLGERDCSIQRRHQKILEETPSPGIDDRLRARLFDAALALARAVRYESAGTVEFLVDDRGEFQLLEMNARLQVEHPVTEAVTGRDLVADQLRIAAREPLDFSQDQVAATGHAVEVRLYAEDAESGFLPAIGQVLRLRWPTGEGIRVDAGIAEGDEIGGRFDPMLAKIIAHGRDRAEALTRLAAALDETLVLGVVTNLRFLRWLVRHDAVVAGEARIDTLERIWPPEHWAATLGRVPDSAWVAAADALGGAWRLNGPRVARLASEGETRRIPIVAETGLPEVIVAGGVAHVDVGGRSVAFAPADPPDVERAAVAAGAHGAPGGSALVVAPMPGTVLAVHLDPGARVAAGDPLITIEAMKMEHIVDAPSDGRVTEVAVRPGDQVGRGQPLVGIGPWRDVPQGEPTGRDSG